MIGWARVGINQDYIIRKRIVDHAEWCALYSRGDGDGSARRSVHRQEVTAGLTRLVAAAESIRSGDRSRRATLSGGYEIVRLGTAFNEMLDALVSNERIPGNGA